MQSLTASTPPLIAGIDGCKTGWLAIAHQPGSSTFSAKVLTSDELETQPWTLAAIDIPIGLPEQGAREADLLARRFIGPRRSSVFPCPIRPAIAATSWREASDITLTRDGRKISQQAFGILPKIREVDECLRRSSLKDRLFEVHPEVSFAAWQQGHMLYPKRDRQGHEQRRQLIAGFFGAGAFSDVSSQVRGRGVAADDIADAFAALWTADRLLQGIVERLPHHDTRDSFNLPMAIWY